MYVQVLFIRYQNFLYRLILLLIPLYFFFPAEPKSDDSKKAITEVKETEEPQETKPANSFDLEELFKMDWIPGLLPVSPITEHL